MASPLAMVLGQQAPAQATPTPTVAGTNVAGIFKDSYDAAMEKYKADMARNNAMWGGLAGLGGAGITAFGPKLFGGASAAGASGAGAGVGASLAPTVGAEAGGASIAELLPFLLL